VAGGAVAQQVDGRTMRAQRTRAAIVSAHLALLAEGDLKPTAQRIADRAEVSSRALWTHFSDLEALFEATAAAVLIRQEQTHRAVSTDLDLPSRIEQFCGQRVRQLEMIGPFARASQIREPFSPALRRYHAGHVRRVSAEIRTVFAQELVVRGAGRDRQVHAVTAATTWGGWLVLRDHLALGVVPARRTMVLAVTALLPPRPDG
jgi:TetR/AcrR family transcriptional regulator of autoinduction and epiphytic fitness